MVAWSLWWQAAARGRPNGPWRLLACALRAALWLGGALIAFVALAAPGEVGPFAIVVSPSCAVVALGAFSAARQITRTLKAAPTL